MTTTHDPSKVTVVFGDGTDDGTAYTVFGALAEQGYVVRITGPDNPEGTDIVMDGVDFTEEGIQVEGYLWDDDHGNCTTDPENHVRLTVSEIFVY